MITLIEIVSCINCILCFNSIHHSFQHAYWLISNEIVAFIVANIIKFYFWVKIEFQLINVKYSSLFFLFILIRELIGKYSDAQTKSVCEQYRGNQCYFTQKTSSQSYPWHKVHGYLVKFEMNNKKSLQFYRVEAHSVRSYKNEKWIYWRSIPIRWLQYKCYQFVRLEMIV